jgi:hypothetical protein
MSLVAGAFSRSADRPLDDALCDELRRLISRQPEEGMLTEFRDRRAYFVKLDVNAYGRPAAIRDEAGCISLVTGEALLSDAGPISSRGRDEELALLHSRWLQDDWEGLRRAEGVFSAVHYRPAPASLRLITDKLGVRPLHVWYDDHLVVFATALRVLEELAAVPKQMDLQAVLELMSIGIPLADRTPYTGVFRLKAAEIVRIEDAGVSRSQYWRWDEIPVSDWPDDVAVRELDGRFRVAVARRLGSDTAAISFLTGGMDSRAMVAILRDRGATVHTFNFSPIGTQDQAFAQLFAEQVGARHHQFAPTFDIDAARNSVSIAAAKRDLVHPLEPVPERPGLTWSGDGGSVGIGHVYVSDAVVALMRAGKVGDAVDRYIQEQGASLSTRLLRKSCAELARSIPREGILQELSDIRCPDPGRAFHLFLMLNDQRRHLSGHIEHMDIHRQEFQVPFFDGEVLASVIGSPLDPWLNHGLYAKWFALLPAAVNAVPWQTYPGHVPCPLPTPEGLEYQWDAGSFAKLRKLRRRQLLREAARMLSARDFPSEIIDRGRLLLATLAFQTRLRDCGYILRSASTLQQYWQRCDGSYSVRPPRSARLSPA